MRIINLQEFLKLPEGTLFHKWGDGKYTGSFYEMAVKGESLGTRDFCVLGLDYVLDDDESQTIIDYCETTGEAFSFDYDMWGRDGCFENNQKFAVYEAGDIKKLVTLLRRCVPA